MFQELRMIVRPLGALKTQWIYCWLDTSWLWVWAKQLKVTHMFTQNTGERQEAELYFCSRGGIMYDFQPRLFLVLSVKKKPTTCWDFITRKRCLKKRSARRVRCRGRAHCSLRLNIKHSPFPWLKGTMLFSTGARAWGGGGGSWSAGGSAQAERMWWQWLQLKTEKVPGANPAPITSSYRKPYGPHPSVISTGISSTQLTYSKLPWRL